MRDDNNARVNASHIAPLFAAAQAVVSTRHMAAQTTVDLESTPLLRATEELRIGSSSDPNIGFSRIGGVAIDRDGQVYIFELHDGETAGP